MYLLPLVHIIRSDSFFGPIHGLIQVAHYELIPINQAENLHQRFVNCAHLSWTRYPRSIEWSLNSRLSPHLGLGSGVSTPLREWLSMLLKKINTSRVHQFLGTSRGQHSPRRPPRAPRISSSRGRSITREITFARKRGRGNP